MVTVVDPRNNASNQVYLTFDDGPNQHTAEILDILKSRGAKATFFIQGKNVAGREALLARMINEGHEIAVHTWDHQAYSKKSAQQIQDDINSTADAIRNALGSQGIGNDRYTLRFSRPPYGDLSDRAHRAVQATGYNPVFWNVDPQEWRQKTPEPTFVQEKVTLIDRQTKPGSIVLLHDSAVTMTMLPSVLDNLRAKGYRTERLADNPALGNASRETLVGSETGVPNMMRQANEREARSDQTLVSAPVFSKPLAITVQFTLQ